MDMSVFDEKFEKSLIQAIAQGLPLVCRPYQEIAKQIGSTESRVIEGIHRIIQRGDIKRYGVVVRHRELGYRANAMVVMSALRNSGTVSVNTISLHYATGVQDVFLTGLIIYFA